MFSQYGGQTSTRRTANQQCNTTTPRGARQLKQRRIVNSSPLSDTARRLLLHKCSDSGHGSRESAVSTMVVEPVQRLAGEFARCNDAINV